MELVNVTKLVADYTAATDKAGRERLVVVAKGTFSLPTTRGVAPAFLEEQVPLITADQFFGEPGYSAPRYEIDFAPHKPRCDILLNGSCYAPGGQPAKQVTVGIRVGKTAKAFNVVGRRVWKAGFRCRVVPSDPEPFTVLPLSYGNAYGGIDRPTPDPRSHCWYPANPVGLGFRPRTQPEWLHAQPVPNTEKIGEQIAGTSGNYEPMAIGPIGRS